MQDESNNSIPSYIQDKSTSTIESDIQLPDQKYGFIADIDQVFIITC